MGADTGRALPNTRMRRIMLAIQDEMGMSGLTTVLRQAGLQRYVNTLPPPSDEPGLRAGEYAALMQAIENYYGRGARGTLMRIGCASFKRLVSGRRLLAAFYQALFRVLPEASRRGLVLRWLARDLAGPGGQVDVHRDDQRIILVDHESDGTHGRRRETEICWLTLGEVQEALRWGTGVEYDVIEAGCKAQGAPACRFEIGAPVG
jgi:predicted hydrocarbon binding protein